MEQLQTIKVALLGFGTVGGGVFELLRNEKRKCRIKLELK